MGITPLPYLADDNIADRASHPVQQHAVFYLDHGFSVLSLLEIWSGRCVNLGWLYHGYTQDPMQIVPNLQELEGSL